MPKSLSDAAVQQYQDLGYYFPVPVLTTDEVKAIRGRMESFEHAQGHAMAGPQRSKSFLLFDWLDDLIRHERILDAVEDIIGPNILCWNTVFWIKEPGSQSFVSWHQDARYWGLDADELVTAWIALSPASLEAGCMRVLPSSHKDDVMPHDDRYHADNLLTRGQEIAVDVDESKAVSMPLKSGEMSLHNVRIAHASGPNSTDDRRIGISIHYIPTHRRQTVGVWDCAALVRGTDTYGHFELTPRVTGEMLPDNVAFHAKAAENINKILYRGAEINTAKL